MTTNTNAVDPGAHPTSVQSNRPPKFQIGDAVTFINEYGVAFAGKTIVGIEVWPSKPDEYRYFFEPTDSWWFSSKECLFREAGDKHQQSQEGPAMKSNAATPAQGEHTIAYAYPGSPRACRLKHGGAGCYVVQTAVADMPATSFDAALKLARQEGTTPQRWSMDHPSNLRYLSAANRQLVERRR